ncbi:MAG: RnfABCDGE type electron transport complex subunit G [Bacteroidales bacterium]|jgi:electron transport complex protein RnfG|nr:RnfABCDGE type electron transport complex subunit G [Bacteroidales bacterium]
MSKKDSNLLNLVLTLFIIAALAAILLALVNKITSGPIADAQQQKEKDALQKVLPSFTDLKTIYIANIDGSDSLKVYEAISNGSVVGYAVNTYTMQGFNGRIEVMVGFDTTLTIINTEVINQAETPGLGDKITKPDFREQFKGKNPENFILKVKKDKGDVDAITASTITSRAFCDALDRAYRSLKAWKGGA